MPANLATLLRPLTRLARRFIPAREGVAALEFALIAPVMVIMFLGMTEVTVGVNTDRKLALVSRTLADLTARATTMTTTDIANIFAAARIVMQPYSTSTLNMVVTSVLVTTSGTTVTGTVDWSCSSGPSATKRTVGSKYTVPDSFKAAQSFILVENSMTYTPMFGTTVLSNALTFTESTPWPVRSASSVAWSGTACT